jgi:hypothetical protein
VAPCFQLSLPIIYHTVIKREVLEESRDLQRIVDSINNTPRWDDDQGRSKLICIGYAGNSFLSTC